MNCLPHLDFSGLTAFFRHDPNVVCAYVFGSAKNGVVKDGSDLDLAVLLRVPPRNSREEFAYYSKVCDAAKELADRIDLVILNRANPILAFEGLHGLRLCNNDPEESAGFHSRVAREYEDVMGDIECQRRVRAALVDHRPAAEADAADRRIG